MKAMRMTREGGSWSIRTPPGYTSWRPISVLGLEKMSSTPALLGDHAAVQNGYPGADFLDHTHLMGDDHHGDAQLFD